MSLLTSQHQAELALMQQQLADTVTALNEEHSSDLQYYAEEQKLMMSQLVTFLAWEKDDAILELDAAHETGTSTLLCEHQQQLASLQAKMMEQNVDALEAVSVSSEAAAQAMTAQTAELTHDLQQLDSVELETQQIALRLSLNQVRHEHAQSIQRLDAMWELQLAEAKDSHQDALNAALTSAAQDSGFEIQTQANAMLCAHADELKLLMAQHEQQLADIATQREQDRAESLSYLTQALEQLQHEHAHSLASAEWDWTHAQTEQQALHQQLLADLTMAHESSLTTLTHHWQEQVHAAKSEHDTEIACWSLEHDAAVSQLREDAQSAQQLHDVQLINLQLECEQTERKLNADVKSAQTKHAETVAQHAELQTQLQV